MLISDAYRSLCVEMHKTRPSYGGSGHRFVLAVKGLIREWGCATVLDYGCGKGALAKGLLPKIRVTEYDPAIPSKAEGRREVDLVVCTDVLEHVEPECLDEVLGDLQRLARKGVYLAVGTMAADKKMPDGRNAHLIQQPMEWWLPILDKRWSRVSAAELPRLESRTKPSVDFEYIGRAL